MSLQEEDSLHHIENYNERGNTDNTKEDNDVKNSQTNKRAIKMSTVLLKEVSVKLPEEKDCKVTGLSAFTNEISTLVADVENNMLKLFDNKYEFKWKVHVSRDCMGVTVVSEKSFATIARKKLQYWGIETNEDGTIVLKIEEEVQLKHTGFAVHSNGKYIGVLMSSDHQVQIFHLSCDKMQAIDLKTIANRAITPGFTLLLDSDLDRFYISDRDYDKGTKLLSVSFTGEVIWECPVPASVGGIAECDNLLFVVSIGYAKIHIITKDGMDIGNLVTDEGQLPFHICTQPLEKTLFVSYNFTGSDRNIIRVYNLEESLYLHKKYEELSGMMEQGAIL
ncbi:uncharacterized protein LOC128164952 [Crassostrea angulata]|uniref:uncharacterized protein LOC128164952 n=1 Tax=Magallana angulata TaxID=2784310 RepID=UPI0022B1BC3D|nr:uncharacterized protein LOC128164952 [Crassostrea angulata]